MFPGRYVWANTCNAIKLYSYRHACHGALILVLLQNKWLFDPSPGNFQTKNIYFPLQLIIPLFNFCYNYGLKKEREEVAFVCLIWFFTVSSQALYHWATALPRKKLHLISPALSLVWELPDPDVHYMGDSSKFPKSWTFEIQILNLAAWLQNIDNFKFNWVNCL